MTLAEGYRVRVGGRRVATIGCTTFWRKLSHVAQTIDPKSDDLIILREG